MRRMWTASLVVGLLLCSATTANGATTLSIDVLSNRADLISAGDALVAVKIPAGVERRRGSACTTTAATSRARSRCGRTAASRASSTGLALGDERAHARRRPAHAAASVTITNHPNGGPVFSGPQVQPWVCQATAVGRAVQPAGDLRVTSTSRRDGGVRRLRPRRTRRPTSRRRPPTRARRCRSSSASRPATRTATSTRSPSSSTRRSRGRPWAPQEQWNHKLLITHGASCGIDHQAGLGAPDVDRDDAAARSAAASR